MSQHCDASAPPPSYDALQAPNNTSNMQFGDKGHRQTPSPIMHQQPAMMQQYGQYQPVVTPVINPQYQMGTTVVQQTPQGQQQVVVVQSGPLVFGPHPSRLICPLCQQPTLTKVRYENAFTTHMMAFMLSLIGCCCFAFIPYLVDSCKNGVHYCGNCDEYLGTYSINTTNNRR